MEESSKLCNIKFIRYGKENNKKKKEIKPVGCDVGQYLVEKESADKDWLEYEAELAKIRSVDWVTDHTGGNIEITYS